jgi:hypothetical protein
MVNGADRNLMRFAACVSVYRAKFGAWPTHARVDPLVLWDIARHVEAPGFEQLGRLMELRTQHDHEWSIGISVGGSRGVVRYDDVDYDRLPQSAVEETRHWLPLER